MDEIERKTRKKALKSNRYSAKEAAVYSAAGVLAFVMLLFAGFPITLLFVIAGGSFLVWRLLTPARGSAARKVLEFYLLADGMISDPQRRWYGFEVDDVIELGEDVVEQFDPPPPLALFALGCLYKMKGELGKSTVIFEMLRRGDHEEIAITDPSPDFRSYAAMRRKIENSPAENPLVSRAIRRLERYRRSKLGSILAELPEHGSTAESADEEPMNEDQHRPVVALFADERPSKRPASSVRPPITEVLHSVYDKPSDNDN